MRLMTWAESQLRRHRFFVSVVLTAMHDDGSHTAEGRTNWLVQFAGLPALRVSVAEYLGVRIGAAHVALVSAMAVWRSFPPEPGTVDPEMPPLDDYEEEEGAGAGNSIPEID